VVVGMNAPGFLVTGGTGSLGSRVVERLHGAGREVRVFSRSGGEGRVRGDLATGKGLEAAVQGVETIVHCASSPTRTRQVDVEGTELVREIREAEPEMPILVLALAPEPEVHERLREMGVKEVLAKGVSGEELVATIRRLESE
jgi:DNA-binding NarL/FixJ family response regulator